MTRREPRPGRERRPRPGLSFELGLRSLRSRRTTFAATAVAAVLATTLLSAFAVLLQTGLDAETSAADRTTLITIALAVSTWGALIVVSSLASLLSLTVTDRAQEFAVLRTVGASRGQVRALVAVEATAVCLLAGAVGLLPGWAIAHGLLHLLSSADLIQASLQPHPAAAGFAVVLLTVVLAGVVAAVFATRSITAGAPAQALTATGLPRKAGPRWRLPLAALVLAAGAVNSVLTATVMAEDPDPYAPMMTAGPAAVLWSLGLALLAPELLRLIAWALTTALPRPSAPLTASMALASARTRPHQLTGVLTPVLVFVGTAAGTLSLTQIDAGRLPAGDDVGATIHLVNLIIVGMISVFAAVMVVNGSLSAVSGRRREFTQHRLAGFTRGEVMALTGIEGVLVCGTAVAGGAVAYVAAVVPYSLVRVDRWVPAGGTVALYGVVCAAAAVLTVGTIVIATRAVAVAAPASLR